MVEIKFVLVYNISVKVVIAILTKEQLKHSIDKYGDSSKLVNRLGITEEEITEVVVLAPWWHPNKLYKNYECKIELLSDEFPDVHRITIITNHFFILEVML